MTSPDQRPSLVLRVSQVRRECDDVLGLWLEDPAGRDLPPWTPGSHIDVQLPSGLVRQYSLVGDPQDRTRYRIAVLREAGGRGGSDEIHTTMLVGQLVGVGGPRCLFPIEDAAGYVLLAGGVGITPFISMIAMFEASHHPWKLLYGGRTRARMAFLETLASHPSRNVEIVCEDESGYPDIAGAIANLPDGWLLYCCGPAAFIDAALAEAEQLDVADRVRFERFLAAPPAARSTAGDDSARDETEFHVELHRRGVTVPVSKGESVLQAIRTVMPEYPSSCETGFCGTCEASVLEGLCDHQDSVLTDQERASNGSMMVCVSRARTPLLVLDV